MRTTLTLDDDLAESLSRTARLTGRSFKPFVVEPQACGLMPGIDPSRLNQLVDQFELEAFPLKQSREGEIA
jgi:hypothetical protein